MEPAALPLAVETLLRPDLVVPLGGAAALLALLGLVLVLPLFIVQRREVRRLLEWQEHQPGAGDPGGLDRPAATSPGLAPETWSRPMTAAERVTSERPALTRIGTAERAAIEARLPFWRRVVERGPRHPLVLSLLAVLAAAAIFVAAGLLLRADSGEEGPRPAVDRAGVEVVVVNASTSAGLAGEVADGVEASGFSIEGTDAASETSQQSVVRYAPDARLAGNAVARQLDIAIVQPFDREAEAAANGADVVVIAGEDRARSQSGKG